MRIAVVDDEPDQADLIRCAMESDDHDCLTYHNGSTFMRDMRRDTFDLLVLDWQLPDTSGIEIIKTVRRSQVPTLPILLLTNRSDERDIVEGLRAGADDFMVKPARVNELIARVQALLRRVYGASASTQYEFGRYRFNPKLQTVDLDSQTLQLTQKEFELSLLLFRHMGRMLSRRYLLESIWTLNNPPDTDLMSRSLDTHISRIRSLLRLRPDNGYRLSAVYGQGYRLEEIENSASAGSN